MNQSAGVCPCGRAVLMFKHRSTLLEGTDRPRATVTRSLGDGAVPMREKQLGG